MYIKYTLTLIVVEYFLMICDVMNEKVYSPYYKKCHSYAARHA